MYESPLHSANYSKYDGLFNLTATYRADSDFDGLYELASGMVWQRSASHDASRDYRGEKSRLAFGIMSNCEASSKRSAYVSELRARIGDG